MNKDDDSNKSRIDDSFGEGCRNQSRFFSRYDLDTKLYHCDSINPNCRYILKKGENKLCGLYYLEDWKSQRSLSDRLKDLRLAHLEHYLSLFKIKKWDFIFNKEKFAKYQKALKILKMRKQNE